MCNKAKERIQDINDSLEWYKKNKPEQYEQLFIPLVQERSRIRKIIEAKKENPAIAAYGESQKGKSYLMGNLLQKNGKPFMVSMPDGKKINFVKSINPIGKKREATGVVTRFSAFNMHNADRYCPQYPVLMKLLTVCDIAIILCDGYFNDLKDYKSYSESEMKALGDEIYNRYKDREEIPNSPLVEDDLLDIKTYVKNYIQANAHSLIDGANSSVFDKIALIARKVPIEEWSNVLSFLWHENRTMTELFNRLKNAISKLKFAREVYLPIDAVMHHGDNKNTIMSVKCLKGLDNKNFDLTTDVYLRDENDDFITVRDFNKSELCAISAEIAYKVDEEYLSTKMEYCMDMIPDETRSKMNKTELKKDVINVDDLLDFPGARNRLKNEEEMLLDIDPDEEASNLVQMFLRGKVAYLFNKYCSSRAIDILMFCQDDEQPNVTEMYSVIRDWVNAYVGVDYVVRGKKISRSQGIAPLFVIATKFNIDMKLDGNDSNDESNSKEAINGRWDGRFNEVLYTQSFKANSVDWFRNWTREGETFKNCYLLRDFKYSGCDGDGTHLYDGYKETDDTPREKELKLPKDFYDRLRTEFVNSEIVGKFFEDPAKSWDLAATINNDGALYIIERLRIVAREMAEIRESHFNEEIERSSNAIRKLIEDDYVPEDENDNILKDINTAKSIMRELDFSCNNNNYFFGHLIQCLQIKCQDVYNIVHNLIKSPTLISQTTNFDHYELILERCGNFESCNSENEKWNRLMNEYALETITEAEEYLRTKNVSPALLFDKKEVRRSNSAIVSQTVYEAWVAQLRSTELLNKMSDDSGFDESVLTALTKRLENTAEYLKLNDRLTESISKYLDVVNVNNADADLVSDIISHLINSFVVDMGFSYRSEEEIEATKTMVDNYELKLFKYIGQGYQNVPKDDDIANMFVEMSVDPKTVTKAFSKNYNQWIEYMFICFLTAGKNLIKNPLANSELGEIIRKLRNA